MKKEKMENTIDYASYTSIPEIDKELEVQNNQMHALHCHITALEQQKKDAAAGYKEQILEAKEKMAAASAAISTLKVVKQNLGGSM